MFAASLSIVLIVSVSGVIGHDSYLGKCPEFPPMPGFDWKEFRGGRWYAMEKFDTTQSKCFTYDFGEDDDGFMYIEQNSVLTGLKRFSVDNKYRYRGRLSAPSRAEPARMIVRFPLNPLGSSSFVVMDTDYNKYALLCTCQSQSILSLVTFHRRSCTILQREPIPDPEVSKKLRKLLNDKVPSSDEPTDHDFDKIDHSNCNYADDGKGIQIDVDKILGLGGVDQTILRNSNENSTDTADYGEFSLDEDVEIIGKLDHNHGRSKGGD